MKNMKITPNEKTYFELINGYIIINEFEKASELLQNIDMPLLNHNLLELYLTMANSIEKMNDLHVYNKNLLKKLSIYSLNALDQRNEQMFRVSCTNSVMNLIKENKFQYAFDLINKFFKNDYLEEDPTQKDINGWTRIDVVRHFCNYLVKANPPPDIIFKYQTLLDENLTTVFSRACTPVALIFCRLLSQKINDIG